MYQFAQYGVIGVIIAAATMYHRVLKGGKSYLSVDLKSVYSMAVLLPHLINTFTISSSSNIYYFHIKRFFSYILLVC